LTPILVGTLAKGKAKNVIVVEGSVFAPLIVPTPIDLIIDVDVNGIGMEPSGGYSGMDCTAGGIGVPSRCTVTGTFWLDIDQNPSLNGVPLTVTLQAKNTVPLVSVNASMSIRLEKK
jgi:hypothetical protein